MIVDGYYIHFLSTLIQIFTLEEKKGVVDRSTTIIANAKEPEGK